MAWVVTDIEDENICTCACAPRYVFEIGQQVAEGENKIGTLNETALLV
jgi:hypothetical protein